jgi:hypothetical protein
VAIDLVWMLQSEVCRFVDVMDFPRDRLWNMLLQFAPSKGLKFKRTQFEDDDMDTDGGYRIVTRLIARIHFVADDLPF